MDYSPHKTPSKRAKPLRRTTSLDSNSSLVGMHVDSTIFGRHWPSDIPSKMVAVFRADPFAFRTHATGDEDPVSPGMDIDDTAIVDPAFPFLSTGPLQMFAHNFQLSSYRESDDDHKSVKTEDSGTDDKMELDSPVEAPSALVDVPMAKSAVENTFCSPISAVNYTRSHLASPLRSDGNRVITSPTHHSTSAHLSPSASHDHWQEESRRIYSDERSTSADLLTHRNHLPDHRPAQVYLSSWSPNPQSASQVGTSSAASHSLVSIYPPGVRSRAESYSPGISPSSSFSSLSSAPSLPSCRTTPSLLTPSSSFSDMTTPSSIVSPSDGLYPRSRIQRPGFNLVPLPSDTRLLESPMSSDSSTSHSFSDAHYHDALSQARADPGPGICLPYTVPVHVPQPAPRDLQLYLRRQHENLQHLHQSPEQGRQTAGKSKVKIKSSPQRRSVYPCHLCPRQFNLPNGLALHIKWHRTVAARINAREQELANQYEQEQARRTTASEHDIAQDYHPLRRYDSRDDFIENDSDLLMIVPPYLPKQRNAEPEQVSPVGPPRERYLDGLTAHVRPPGCVGLGLIHDAPMIDKTTTSFGGAPAPHSAPAPSSLSLEARGRHPSSMNYIHVTPVPSVSWSTLSNQYPVHRIDEKLSRNQAIADCPTTDQLSYDGRQYRLLPEFTGYPVSPHVRYVPTQPLPQQSESFVRQRPHSSTPPRPRHYSEVDSAPLSPLKELVALRPLPFGQNSDVSRS